MLLSLCFFSPIMILSVFGLELTNKCIYKMKGKPMSLRNCTSYTDLLLDQKKNVLFFGFLFIVSVLSFCIILGNAIGIYMVLDTLRSTNFNLWTSKVVDFQEWCGFLVLNFMFVLLSGFIYQYQSEKYAEIKNLDDDDVRIFFYQ